MPLCNQTWVEDVFLCVGLLNEYVRKLARHITAITLFVPFHLICHISAKKVVVQEY